MLPALCLGGVTHMVGRLSGGATKLLMKNNKNWKGSDATEASEPHKSPDSNANENAVRCDPMSLSLFVMAYAAEANYQSLKNMRLWDLNRVSVMQQACMLLNLTRIRKRLIQPPHFIVDTNWDVAIEGMEYLLQNLEDCE
jgi:hypothetical protein